MNSLRRPRLPVRRLLISLAGLLLAAALSGCVGLWGSRDHHTATSVVQFLYPDRDLPFVEPQIPTLRLPLRVGIAFVPPADSSRFPAGGGIAEQERVELLGKTAEQFRALPFVQSIQIIPATYLRPGGGFANLDQVGAMLGIDVIALVAYDQAQNSSDTEASLAYWTIVGAYVVEGQRNSTHTLMEAAVYDIRSRSLLFRAPGTSSIRNHATLIRNEYELRKASAAGFQEASAQMTANLAHELELFKVRARQDPTSVRIEHRPGYAGAGAFDAALGSALLALLVAARLGRRS